MVKKQDVIKIVVGTYKVTKLIPDNEPLRIKIREVANDILGQFAGYTNKKELNSKIDMILSYFEVAKTQNWTDISNFDILQRNYKRLKQYNVQPVIQKKIQQSPKIKSIGSLQTSKPSKRQTQIINLVKIKGQIGLDELKKSFPQVTPRTLRRDINRLSEKSVIQRIRSNTGEVVFILQNQEYNGHLFNK